MNERMEKERERTASKSVKGERKTNCSLRLMLVVFPQLTLTRTLHSTPLHALNAM